MSKEDTGTESNTEKEKGLASDSFKRACFNWGIGRELYDYPFISVKLHDNEYEVREEAFNGKPKKKAYATWNLKIKEWKWSAEFDDNGKIKALKAVDSNGIRFSWGKIQAPKNASAKDACKEEFDKLTPEMKEYLRGIADEAHDIFSRYDVTHVVTFLQKEQFSNDIKTALWYLLDSKLRSALKKEDK